MKQFIFKPNVIIPDYRIHDVTRLREFIVLKMGIQISLVDAYNLWLEISGSWDAGWLSFDFDNWQLSEGDTPEEFIERYMERFGAII